MIFDTRIKGIPCQINVTNYVDTPARTYGPPEDCYPAEFEFEYIVLDRKGYRAEWLEAKIDAETENDIYTDFQEHLESYDPF